MYFIRFHDSRACQILIFGFPQTLSHTALPFFIHEITRQTASTTNTQITGYHISNRSPDISTSEYIRLRHQITSLET